MREFIYQKVVLHMYFGELNFFLLQIQHISRPLPLSTEAIPSVSNLISVNNFDKTSTIFNHLCSTPSRRQSNLMQSATPQQVRIYLNILHKHVFTIQGGF
jgi:hypothetical protein